MLECKGKEKATRGYARIYMTKATDRNILLQQQPDNSKHFFPERFIIHIQHVNITASL